MMLLSLTVMQIAEQTHLSECVAFFNGAAFVNYSISAVQRPVMLCV